MLPEDGEDLVVAEEAGAFVERLRRERGREGRKRRRLARSVRRDERERQAHLHYQALTSGLGVRTAVQR